jgi:hypothetical protein
MAAGAALSLVWLFSGRLEDGWLQYPFSLQPLYPGLLGASISYAAVKIAETRGRRS